jgi:hypothetical protein
MPGLAKGFGSPRPFKAKPKPAGYVFGRPTLYRPEYCEAVISFMSEGYDLTAFAGSISVSRDAVYDWMVRYPDFHHAVQVATAKRLHALQRKLLTTKVGVGVTAAIFALKNAAPDDWQDRYNSTTQVNVNIRSMPDAQLEQIAARGLTIEHDASEIPQQSNER